MKYWVYDGKEATGPYDPEELKKLPGFGPSTMIAPDGADTADEWKPASYYLIRPPNPRSEPAAEPRPASEPKAEAAPVVEPEEDALAAAAVASPMSWRSPVVPVTLGLAALAAVSGGAYYARQKKLKAAPVEAAAVSAPAPAPAPAAAPAPPPPVTAEEEAARTDALNLVQKFKIVSPGGKYPANPFDVLSPKRWKAPRTLGQLYELRPLEGLSLEALQEAQRRGQPVAQAAKELRKDSDAWKAFAEKFLKARGGAKWEVKLVSPELALVSAHLRSPRTGAPEHRSFEVDLKRRALKPTDFDAWCDVDAKTCAKWARAHLKLGDVPDQAALAAAAPAYEWPRLKTKARPQSPGTRPEAVEEAGDAPVADASPEGDEGGGLPAAEPARKKPEPIAEEKEPAPAAKPVVRSKKAGKRNASTASPGDADDFDPLAEAPPPEHASAAPQSVPQRRVPAPTRAKREPAATPVEPTRAEPAPATDSIAPSERASAKPVEAVPPLMERLPGEAGMPSKTPPPPPGQPVPPSPGAKKSVTDMNVDELEKYLNRK